MLWLIKPKKKVTDRAGYNRDFKKYKKLERHSKNDVVVLVQQLFNK